MMMVFQIRRVAGLIFMAAIMMSAAHAQTTVADERIEALELRLSQMEQLLTAQRNLRTRQQLTDTLKLRARLDRLESEMAVRGAPAALNTAPLSAAGSSHTAELQTRFNDMAEILRALQAQTDSLILQMRSLNRQAERSATDNEFRFQALESGVRRATAGISSTSSEPEIIGTIKRTAPVEGFGQDANTDTLLVGEGDLSTLEDFGQLTRPPLNDPKMLYDRAFKDLQGGNYHGAEADFTQLVQTFPSHKLAGNAQYWLGETHYVRRQYKQAAEAFLVGYTTYDKSKKAPDSLLKLGMTLTALGEKKTSCDAFAELGAKFPDAPEAVVKRAQIERKRAGCGS